MAILLKEPNSVQLKIGIVEHFPFTKVFKRAFLPVDNLEVSSLFCIFV